MRLLQQQEIKRPQDDTVRLPGTGTGDYQQRAVQMANYGALGVVEFGVVLCNRGRDAQRRPASRTAPSIGAGVDFTVEMETGTGFPRFRPGCAACPIGPRESPWMVRIVPRNCSSRSARRERPRPRHAEYPLGRRPAPGTSWPPDDRLGSPSRTRRLRPYRAGLPSKPDRSFCPYTTVIRRRCVRPTPPPTYSPPAGALGNGDRAEIQITVDRTFVRPINSEWRKHRSM